jgi:hypothetical protein
VRGVRRWSTSYEVRFDSPEDGQMRKVGDYVIKIAWPILRIQAPTAQSRYILEGLCWGFEIKLTKKTDALEEGEILVRVHRPKEVKKEIGATWCSCPLGPIPASVQKPEMSDSTIVTCDGAHDRAIGDVAAIKLIFFKPFEEPFDFRGPVLK